MTDYLPHTSKMLWPDQDDGPFRLRLYWGIVDGQVECVGIELTSVRNPDMPWDANYGDPDDPDTWRQMQEPGNWSPSKDFPFKPTPVTSSLLRSLNLASIVGDTKEWTADFHEYFLTKHPELLADLNRDISRREEQLEAVERLRGKKRRGRYGPDHWASVARTYLRSLPTGAPTEAVAEKFSVSKSTAAKWVRKARDLEFLGETQKGKAGGVPPSHTEGTEE
jgi:hypothetical protein